MDILKVENLSSEYLIHNKAVKILRDVSFTLKKGETIAVVGESGSGKTTLGYSILRLIMPWEGRITGGKILFNPENSGFQDILSVNKNDLRDIRSRKISIIFQDSNSSLNPVMKISSQMTELLENKLSEKQKKSAAIAALQMVKLPERIYNSYPHQLSGGQKQRVAIAMSTLNNPEILIADEPTTGLDATIAREIVELLYELKEKYKMSLILITHNLRLAYSFCERIIVMYAGEVFETADAKSITNNPKHPYTMGLSEALPDARDIKKELKPLQGNPPSHEDLPQGCYFAPRCHFKMALCEKSHPEIFKADGTAVRCFLHKPR